MYKEFLNHNINSRNSILTGNQPDILTFTQAYKTRRPMDLISIFKLLLDVTSGMLDTSHETRGLMAGVQPQ